MERALFHLDNCYRIPNLCASGYLCKTNLPSCTSFRGFGAPQSLLLCEHWISDIATTLGISQYQVSTPSTVVEKPTFTHKTYTIDILCFTS